MRIPSGTVDQYVYFVAVDATDFTTRETGQSSFTVYRSRNGGASAAMTTPTINETDVTNMPGVYELLLDEDMTIDAGDDEQEMVFHITHAGMAPVTRAITLYRSKITAGNTLGVESDGDLTKVNTLDGHTAQTGDNYARLGAPAGASVSADVAAVKVDTAATLVDTAEIGTAGAGLTDLGGMSTAMKAEVNAEADTALTDYDAPTKTEMDTAFTEIKGGTWSDTTDTLEHIRNKQTDIETDTQDLQTKVGTPAADVSADIAAVKVDTAATLVDTNEMQGKLPTNNIMGSSVTTDKDDEIDAIKAVTDNLPNSGSLTDLATAANLATADANIDTLLAGLLPNSTTIAMLSSQVSFTLTAGSTDDDAYNGWMCVVQNVSTAAQYAVGTVDDYTGSSKTVTLLTDPGVFTMATNDKVYLLPRPAVAANLEALGLVIGRGTVDTVTNTHTPTTTVFQADDITEATADHYIGRIVTFKTGALTDQSTDITDYEAVGGIAQFTVTALTEAPSNNDTFVIS